MQSVQTTLQVIIFALLSGSHTELETVPQPGACPRLLLALHMLRTRLLQEWQ